VRAPLPPPPPLPWRLTRPLCWAERAAAGRARPAARPAAPPAAAAARRGWGCTSGVHARFEGAGACCTRPRMGVWCKVSAPARPARDLQSQVSDTGAPALALPAAPTSQAGARARREGPGRGGKKRRGHLVAAIVQRKLDCRGWRLVVTGHSLGAGAAALIAMRLHSRFPGTAPRARPRAVGPAACAERGREVCACAQRAGRRVARWGGRRCPARGSGARACRARARPTRAGKPGIDKALCALFARHAP